MNEYLETGAIVLKSSNFGEYDRRLVMLTADRGKITVFARGARRQGSRHLASCSPFSCGVLKAFPGRNAYTLMDFSVERYFEGLRSDFELSCLGMYFLEVADYYTRENNDEIEMMRLLYVALSALEKCTENKEGEAGGEDTAAAEGAAGAEDTAAAEGVAGGESVAEGGVNRAELIRWSYEMKAVAVNGEFEGPDALPELSGGARAALAHIAGCRVKDLMAYSVSSRVYEELRRAAAFFRSRHLHGDFKSLTLLTPLQPT